MPASSLPWEAIDRTPATELVSARLALHYATQAVSAQADALLPKAPDDSQSNLGYFAGIQGLVTHALPGNFRAGISLAQAEWHLLDHQNRSIANQTCSGHSVRQGIDWFAAALREQGIAPDAPPTMRDYDMPEAPYLDAPLPDCGAHARAIENWFHKADTLLQAVASTNAGASPVRCWPHHFDLATLITLDSDRDPEAARSIGVGMSPGDGGYPEPYFYINLWPSAEHHTHPELPAGTWHTEGWFGGVLTGSQIQAATDETAAVIGFVETAVAANRAALEKL